MPTHRHKQERTPHPFNNNIASVTLVSQRFSITPHFPKRIMEHGTINSTKDDDLLGENSNNNSTGEDYAGTSMSPPGRQIGQQQPLEEKINNPQQSNPADQALLEWLCTNIDRDGGATLVTSLKDHYWQHASPKKLNQLLVQSSIQKPKLLTFLEAYSPSLFSVDRHASPHWVVLQKPYSNNYIREDKYPLGGDDDEDDDCISINSSKSKRSIGLYQKLLYIMRRRHARLFRRVQYHQKENHPEASKVNVAWLVKESSWELHFYLRSVDYYRTIAYAKQTNTPMDTTVVHAVLSPAWQNMVVGALEDFLRTYPGCSQDFQVDEETHKAWLKTDTPSEVQQQQQVNYHETQSSVGGSIGQHSDKICDNQDKGNVEAVPAWLDPLLCVLFHVVQTDGSTRVALGLLLHRHASLKLALGGRDLVRIYEDYPERFRSAQQGSTLEVSQRQGSRGEKSNCNVYVQWKPSLLGGGDGETPLSKEDEIAHHSISKYVRSGGGPTCSSDQPTNLRQSRMKVDSVGLFSVTNSRWASAIANIVIHACQYLEWAVSELTVIDMTASIGGMTLGLAKGAKNKKKNGSCGRTTFQKIMAYELDPTRARLCQENMQDHGIDDDLVTVHAQDSVAAIPTFPRHRCCIVIDPPWGGEHYKEFKDDPPLELGPWRLEDVIAQIAEHVADSVVAVRLPVTLNVTRFLDEKLKRDRKLRFEQLTIRKLNVQLLVVIRLFGTSTTSSADGSQEGESNE